MFKGTVSATRFVITAPFRLPRFLYRCIGRFIGAWIFLTRDSLACRGCGEPILLTDRWECGGCGYVFDGFAFSRCPNCGSVPPFIPCRTCGVGMRNLTSFP